MGMIVVDVKEATLLPLNIQRCAAYMRKDAFNLGPVDLYLGITRENGDKYTRNTA